MASQVFFDAPDLDRVEAWVRAQPPYAALAFVPQEAATVKASYQDTVDWAVYRAGYSLCIEHSAGTPVVRLASRSGKKQVSLVQPLDQYTASLATASGDVSGKVRLLAGDAALISILEVTTHRRSFLVEQGTRPVAVLNLDAMTVRPPEGEASSLSRVEINNLVGGAAISSFVEAMTATCGLSATRESQLAAALRVIGVVPEAAFAVSPDHPPADTTTGEFALATIRRFFRELQMREPGTRLGEEPEDLHQMRVATRRLRAAISVFRTALDPSFVQLQDELRWLGVVLGEVRDLDVRLQWLTDLRRESNWDDAAAVGPLIEDTERLQREARERLLVALSSARYEELVGGLTLALEKADSGALDFDTPVGDFVLPTLRKKYRRLRRISKTLALDSEAAAYHEARKRGKKLRYATEFFADILGKPATRLVEATKQVQDLLGEHQDASVTVGWLRESVATRGHIYPPGTLLRMGELLEKQNVKMVELRRQCPSAFDKLRGGWKALRKSVRRNSSDASSADRSEKAALPLRRHMWPLHRLFARRGPRPH